MVFSMKKLKKKKKKQNLKTDCKNKRNKKNKKIKRRLGVWQGGVILGGEVGVWERVGGGDTEDNFGFSKFLYHFS